MRAFAAGLLMVLALAACGITKPAASGRQAGCKPTATPSLAPSPPGDQEINYRVKISQGETIKRPVAVLPQQHLFAVFAEWQYGHVAFSLISPSGRVYDTNTTDPAAHHHINASGETFAIDRPEPGQWTIQLVGDRVPSQGGVVYIQITEMPQSDFAPIAVTEATPDRGVAPVTVKFNSIATPGEAGVTIVSYRWDFGDCSSASSEMNPTHRFTAAGTYGVVLTATDSNGQVGTAIQQVVVTAYNHPPTAVFAWGSLDQARPNDVYFDAQNSNDIDGSITGYKWDFGDGATGSGVGLLHTYSRSGTYGVTLTVTDDGGLTATITQGVTTGGFFLPPPSSP